MLRSRNCTLDLESHRYIWDPHGARIPMRVGVTGVTNHGKDPERFRGYEALPIAAPTSTGAWRPWPKTRSCRLASVLEGIDCSDWFDQLHHGEISKGLTMSDFWKEAEILATEYTMVSQKRSLGGQLDLLVKFRGSTWLVDLKTKSASSYQRSQRRRPRSDTRAQAGGIHSG